jgi:hypothetical protein
MLETTPLVNSTSQGILAKLLAKENITVDTGNYSTAFFDVKNRILGLPTWNTSNKSVSDLLVGHEVGHALYTPVDSIAKFKEVLPLCPFDIFNIVEDIRIEKLVQDQYPGLISSFTSGYANFIENDFFQIEGKDLTMLPFADRLNLQGKIGNQLDIPLNAEEAAIYQRCLAAESVDDVIEACKEIYEMVKDSLKKQAEEAKGTPNTDEDAETSPSQPSNDAADSKEEDSKGEDSDEKQESKQGDSDEKQGDSDEKQESGQESTAREVSDRELHEALKSKTLSDLNEQLENMQQSITDHIPVMAPTKEQIMKTVTPVAKIMEARKRSTDYHYYSSLPEVVEDWKQFKASTKQHVNLLVKEFERRKAAFQYSRAQQSTTGSIDVNRLHSYKFEDQIFKSVTKLADAKNHGMIFFIDYSGSMRYDLPNVLNHTLNLVFFCKAVGIPFEVYGFTNPQTEHETMQAEDINHRQISVAYTSVFELLNSTMKKGDYDLACRQLRAQSFLFFSPQNPRRGGFMPMASCYEQLWGTPLYETIIVAHELVKRFKQKHRVQKMNTIFLTDGDGGGFAFGQNRAGAEHCKKDVTTRVPYRARINGRQVDLMRGNPSFNYAALIENLRITCGTTAIGFFISTSRSQIKQSAINALRHTKGNEIKDWAPAAEKVNSLLSQLRKNKCMMIPNGFSFDEYFIISGGDLKLDDDNDNFVDDVDADMTTAGGRNQMAKAFTKYTSDKRASRLILNKFAALVA